MSEPRLPESFADLQCFVAGWAVPSMAARAALRDTSTETQRAAFHLAAKDRIGAMLDHLDACPLEALDPGEAALLDLALAFVHVALAVEVQRDSEAFHALHRTAMQITREPS
jgi:hypothetical protein